MHNEHNAQDELNEENDKVAKEGGHRFGVVDPHVVVVHLFHLFILRIFMFLRILQFKVLQFDYLNDRRISSLLY